MTQPLASPRPIDVELLYRTLSPRLQQIVRCDVPAPEAVIEDACQFAWAQLIRHAEGVRGDAVLSWLARTAVREAVKVLRREERGREGDAEAGDAAGDVPGAMADGPHELAERRWQLGEIKRLPARQQRVLWLQLLGLSYEEIAEISGCSCRTVERQLLRAKDRMRQLAG